MSGRPLGRDLTGFDDGCTKQRGEPAERLVVQGAELAAERLQERSHVRAVEVGEAAPRIERVR